MDAILKKTRQGSRQHRSAIVAVAFFAALFTGSDAHAQALRLQSRSGDQQIVHTMKSTVQTFPPVRWDIQNAALAEGCLVQWTAESFVRDESPDVRADCELNLRLVQANRNARWTVTAPFDTSNLAAGKDSATVSVSSRGPGQAQLELTVSFINHDLRRLASGDYQTYVTGTISGL